MQSKQKKQKADIWHKNAYALEKQIWYSDTVKKWVRCGLTFIFMEVSEMKKCNKNEEKGRPENKNTFRIAMIVGGAVLIIAACIAIIILL